MNAATRTAFARRPRGSVLIFAIVFLVILAGLGTAFVMFVIQQSRASANTLHGTEADAVGDAALAHARQVLLKAVGVYRCFSPDAAFDPNRPYATAYETPYYRNLHAKASTYFVGSDLSPQPLAGTGGDDDWPPGELYMTPGLNKYVETVPASGAGVDDAYVDLGNVYRTFEAFDDEITVDPTSVNAGDYALLYYGDTMPLYYDPPKYVNPLHFTETPLTTTCNLDGSDFQAFNASDGAGPVHYGLARRWQLRSPQTGFYNAGAARDLARVANTRGEYYVWIDNLDGKLFANPQEWDIVVPGAYLPDATGIRSNIVDALLLLGAGEKTKLLTTIPPGTNLTDNGDLAQRLFTGTEYLDRTAANLKASGDAARSNYLIAKNSLERYLTVNRDESFKLTATSLNINTAPLEVLVAALSQIPLSGDVADPTDGKAIALAKRICAKRPFLCRMDFEDFLAAHLNSDTSASAAADPLNATPPTTAVNAVYQAILLREYPPLTNMMEIFSGTTLVPFDDEHPVYGVLRKADYQQNRFVWFREEDSLAPRANAYIDLKAFSNLLNSLSGQRRDGKYGFSFYSSGRVKTERVAALGNLPSGIPEIEHNYEIDAPFRYVYKDSTGARWDLIPKFEFNRLTQTQIDAGQTKYQFGSSAADPGALCHWHATDSSGYYEVTFGSSEDEQKKEFASVVPNPVPPTTPEPFVLLGATPNTPAASALTPAAGDDTTVGSEILDGAAGTGNTFVQTTIHAPIRTYRLPSPFDSSIPAPTATVADGLNGDVAWSPRADFRGRYFKIYILARGIVTIAKDPSSGVETTHYGATRRIEALYDALDDELLWRRNVSTELRTLGDPSP